MKLQNMKSQIVNSKYGTTNCKLQIVNYKLLNYIIWNYIIWNYKL